MPAPHPNLVFHYFNETARSESVRLCLHLANIPFTDNRIEMSDWPSLKPNTTYNRLPVLSIDGKNYGQGVSVTRYTANLANLYPTNIIEQLRADEVLEVTNDLITAAFRYGGSDEKVKKADRKKLVEQDYPQLFGTMEQQLRKWNTEWAVGDTMSVADLAIFSHVAFVKSGFTKHLPTDLLDGHKKAIMIYEKVDKMEEIQEWYQKNPLNPCKEP